MGTALDRTSLVKLGADDWLKLGLQIIPGLYGHG